ncbi:cytochrome c [Flavobacterium sp. DG1-102-2]|uniref:cytochrome c n=1 Tax=Flavobacterium sp. DG1-102-2 TaxID=3081663 RepID=UPI002949A4D5|nr:cytochrome c [Flavobacterium sp. DG1-102-2]MDV6169248.1 cytochrome c [Flavobacterium sp. DG1-102-2]
MKAIQFLSAALMALFLYSCDSHTYTELEETPPVVEGKVTYTANVKTIIDNVCTSCHSANGSASFRPLTTYAEVKDAVQNAGLLDRIQLENGEPGLMPQGGRMPQNRIDLILKWNEDGLLEN